MMWKLKTDKVRVGSEVIWLTGHPKPIRTGMRSVR